MIKAIEVKSTENCRELRSMPIDDDCRIRFEMGLKIKNQDDFQEYRKCVGLDSPDCPLNAIRCGTCSFTSHNCPQWGLLAYEGFCSAYEPKET